MLRRLSSKKLKKGQAFLFSTTSLFVWNNEGKVNSYPSVTTLNLYNSNNLNEVLTNQNKQNLNYKVQGKHFSLLLCPLFHP